MNMCLSKMSSLIVGNDINCLINDICIINSPFIQSFDKQHIIL